MLATSGHRARVATERIDVEHVARVVAVVSFLAAVVGGLIAWLELVVMRSSLYDYPPIPDRAPTDDDWRRWRRNRARSIRIMVMVRRVLVLGGLAVCLVAVLFVTVTSALF